MAELKTDLHTHSADDPRDDLAYSSEMLIDAAAQLNYQVLALTCHDGIMATERLAAYARRRGILLVPGIEASIEGKHVVILNADAEQASAGTFNEVRALGRRDAAFIAPHPYYPSMESLGRVLEANIDLFDAIEYCSFYFRWAGFNRKAVRIARKYGLPLIGTSDVHMFPYHDSTHARLEAPPVVADVVAAIRQGRVALETRPRTLLEGIRPLMVSLRHVWRTYAGSSAGPSEKKTVSGRTPRKPGPLTQGDKCP